MPIMKLLSGLFFVSIFVACLGSYFAFMYYTAPPKDFITQTVTIEPGTPLREITAALEEASVVRSALGLELIFSFFEDSTQIKAGTYEFTEPMDARVVARILVEGQFGNDLLSITFVEGLSAAAYGSVAAKTLETFDQEQWKKLTEASEGSLFPDTYHIPPAFTTSELFALMTETHADLMREFEQEIASSTYSEQEIVILASILEREANDETSMRTVAGIFSNRLEIGMPLQADATIEYALESPLGELPPGQLATELRELESPYNTYKNPGLPPTPIGNPGRLAIEAVLNPISSDYFYYITGDDGVFYYATTYNQHLTNIERYLR